MTLLLNVRTSAWIRIAGRFFQWNLCNQRFSCHYCNNHDFFSTIWLFFSSNTVGALKLPTIVFQHISSRFTRPQRGLLWWLQTMQGWGYTECVTHVHKFYSRPSRPFRKRINSVWLGVVFVPYPISIFLSHPLHSLFAPRRRVCRWQAEHLQLSPV